MPSAQASPNRAVSGSVACAAYISSTMSMKKVSQASFLPQIYEAQLNVLDPHLI